MSATSLHVESTTANGDEPATSDMTVPVAVDRLRHLEMLEMRANLDARTIQSLQTQLVALEDALKGEQARGEKHADALMQIARTCDDRARELEGQHTAALAKLEVAHHASVATLRTTHAAAFTQLQEALAQKDATIADLTAEIAALKAQAASKLNEIYTAVAALQTLEIHPVRPDSRQFAAWHLGPVPPLPVLPPPPLLRQAFKFDEAWCAVGWRDGWDFDITATGTRAYVNRRGRSAVLTLRSDTPLPPKQQLPSYRVVVEAGQFSRLGLVPSHAHDTGAVITPAAGRCIYNYGGWYIITRAAAEGMDCPTKYGGWTAMPPASAAAGEAAAGGGNVSAYATTRKPPPTPAGSAVEFAVDYAAGTCRVAFYTPEAVAGGFVEPPHAKMEMRFVATDADAAENIPARLMPTTDSPMRLYPAVEIRSSSGAGWRFM